jgi:hypothetical protein
MSDGDIIASGCQKARSLVLKDVPDPSDIGRNDRSSRRQGLNNRDWGTLIHTRQGHDIYIAIQARQVVAPSNEVNPGIEAKTGDFRLELWPQLAIAHDYEVSVG